MAGQLVQNEWKSVDVSDTCLLSHCSPRSGRQASRPETQLCTLSFRFRLLYLNPTLQRSLSEDFKALNQELSSTSRVKPTKQPIHNIHIATLPCLNRWPRGAVAMRSLPGSGAQELLGSSPALSMHSWRSYSCLLGVGYRLGLSVVTKYGLRVGMR